MSPFTIGEIHKVVFFYNHISHLDQIALHIYFFKGVGMYVVFLDLLKEIEESRKNALFLKKNYTKYLTLSPKIKEPKDFADF